MSEKEIRVAFDQLDREIEQLGADIKALSDDIASQQQRNANFISECLDQILKRANEHDWSKVDRNVRPHPANRFIERVEFFNNVPVHEEAIPALREKFALIGKALVDKNMLSEAELNKSLEKAKRGRD